jgi:hypothetical protein
LAEEINQLHHANVFIKTCMHCTGLPAVWYRHCTASGGGIRRVYRRVRWAPPRVGVLPYTPHHLFLLSQLPFELKAPFLISIRTDTI